ncbi:hypothetical protein [Nocardia amamiensis]|uniref:hypothetical protein n=1 Tax=Nocardia amamiensis TaxID=404578 RepID=UPI000AC36162|nr:hypothetical protein [Nocardia amamiensis]
MAALPQRVPGVYEALPGQAEPPPLLMLWLFADAMAEWAYKDSRCRGEVSPGTGDPEAETRQ